MKTRQIIILGGYGSTGFPIAQLLLAHTDVSITLAGRDLEKARSAAEKLNGGKVGGRLHALRVDAGDPPSLSACHVSKRRVY